MKKISILLFILIPLLAFSQSQSLKRKVAIGRFSNETQYSKSVFYDKDNDPMGKQASDILSAKLAATDKFLLLERQDYDKIEAEVKTSGEVNQGIGADYLIIGSITEYGRKTIGTQGFASQKKEQVVEAAVSIRLVDVSTGIVIYSEEAKGEATTTNKTTLGFGKEADFDATLSDKAISTAINKLVENIITKCMDNPWKAFILSNEDGSIIITGGKSQGLQVGDVFTVLKRGKKVKNPQTGITIELPGTAVGKIKVEQLLGSNIQDEISICSLIEGNIENSIENYFVTQ